MSCLKKNMRILLDQTRGLASPVSCFRQQLMSPQIGGGCSPNIWGDLALKGGLWLNERGNQQDSPPIVHGGLSFWETLNKPGWFLTKGVIFIERGKTKWIHNLEEGMTHDKKQNNRILQKKGVAGIIEDVLEKYIYHPEQQNPQTSGWEAGKDSKDLGVLVTRRPEETHCTGWAKL